MKTDTIEKRFSLKVDSLSAEKFHSYEKKISYRDYAYIYRCEVFQEWLFFYVFLTHSFQMHPYSTTWKHQKTVRFSDVFRG